MAAHLNAAQLAELGDALRRRYVELREIIRQELLRQESEHFVDLAGQVHDAEEESVADLLVDLNLAAIERHGGELEQVEAALARLRRGTYGVCIDSEEPIPFERLRANPAAARTLEAQEQFERGPVPRRYPTL